jgi:hypothetical protein
MGCPHVVGSASLGGLEPFIDRKYLASVVADLTREAMHDATTDLLDNDGKAA